MQSQTRLSGALHRRILHSLGLLAMAAQTCVIFKDHKAAGTIPEDDSRIYFEKDLDTRLQDGLYFYWGCSQPQPCLSIEVNWNHQASEELAEREDHAGVSFSDKELLHLIRVRHLPSPIKPLWASARGRA